MFEIAATITSKIIFFLIGVGAAIVGIFHVPEQAVKKNTESFLGTTTNIAVNAEQKIPETEINKEQIKTNIIELKKETQEKQKQQKINQLEKLVEETSALTKQFSILVEKEKEKTSRPRSEAIPFNKLNQSVRPAIMNIFCTTNRDGELNPISGSGIIISKEGIVLTNAHIAQYFLLKNYQTKNFISCVMRQGDGEKRAFQLDLIYLSPLWVKLHAKDISKQNPTGTGQYDYALLSIGNPTDGSKKPETFPFLSMETDEENIVGNGAVLLASFPAEFLSEVSLQRDLSLVSSVGEIQSIFTFSSTTPTIDLLETKGGVVSQKGSSGGALVNQETGKLVGMITTSTDEKTTGERKLRSITSSYINQEFIKETNTSLASVLDGGVESFKQAFTEQILPSLVKQLEDELDK